MTTDRQTGVLLLTAAGGLLGGLLAVGLLTDRFEAASVWVPLLIVSAAAVLATAVAFLLLTARPAAPGTHQQRPPATQQPWYQASTAPNPPPAPRAQPAAPDPVPRPDPGHLVLPLNENAAQPDARDWWNKSAPAAAASSGAANQNNQPAPALASYVSDGTALVAQCPNCGDFRIDVRRADPAYAFRCRNPRCGEEWRWTPGTAWPSVVVRRNLTGRERG